MVGSYVTQGTRAAQSYIYMSLGWSIPTSFAFYLLLRKEKIFQKKNPLLAPFLC